MNVNTYIIEAEGEGLAGFSIEIEYEYEPGFRGSREEPPEADNINIINIKCSVPRLEDQYRLEKRLTIYEREGGDRYNPADDR
tara:strand:+ start:363 stop:611 length:249 start_codon:yes stop_codon:yes gene_type:complete